MTYLGHLHGDVSADEAYMDAELTVHAALRRGETAFFPFLMSGPQGEEFLLGEEELKEGEEFRHPIRIKAPVKWDSEHPESVYACGGWRMEPVRKLPAAALVFRQIRREGSQVYLE